MLDTSFVDELFDFWPKCVTKSDHSSTLQAAEGVAKCLSGPLTQRDGCVHSDDGMSINSCLGDARGEVGRIPGMLPGL